MFDERGASWRFFLPVGALDSVLTYGLDVGSVISLARAGGQVTAVLTAETKYDQPQTPREIKNSITLRKSLAGLKEKYSLIVIGECSKNQSSRIMKSLIGHLKEDGLFACLCGKGCNVSKRLIRSTGVIDIEEFAAIPYGQPRLFFPLRHKVTRNKGINFHEPGSKKANLLMKITRFLNQIGIIMPLKYGSILLAKRTNNKLNTNLKGWLEDRLERKFLDLVVYAGSESIRRKLTILAVAEDQSYDVVVKVADTDHAREAVLQESAALEDLSGTLVESQIPKLCFQGNYLDDSLVQVQSALESSKQNQIPNLTDFHFQFLSELSRINRHSSLISDSPIWAKIQENFKNLDIQSLPESINRVLIWIRSRVETKQEVVLHRIHGDFAPWNIKISNEGIKVFDWEDSTPDGMAGYDVFHFIYRQAELIGSWPNGEFIYIQMRKAIENLSALSEVDIPFYNNFSLWVLDAYSRNSSKTLEDVASQVINEIYEE